MLNIVSLLTFAGLGTREGALVLLFRTVSLPAEHALAFSLLLVLVGVVGVTVIGFLCYLAKPVK